MLSASHFPGFSLTCQATVQQNIRDLDFYILSLSLSLYYEILLKVILLVTYACQCEKSNVICFNSNKRYPLYICFITHENLIYPRCRYWLSWVVPSARSMDKGLAN